MDNLLKNKKIVIVCFILVFIAISAYLMFNRSANTEYSYDNDNSVEYLRSYGVNEYIPIYVEEADVVIKYLNEFKNSMISDVNVSYNLLNEEYRNKRFGSIEAYKEYIDDIMSVSTFSLEVETYRVINTGDYKYFDVYDTEGYHYIFKEKSIMNFEVYLDNYTIKIG